MAFYRIHNSETNIFESIFDVVVGVYNSAGQFYFGSDSFDHNDKFNITIDQLEGEITVPYQYEEETRPWTQADYDVAIEQWIESGYVTWNNQFPYWVYGDPTWDGAIKPLLRGETPTRDDTSAIRPGPGMWYVQVSSNVASEFNQDSGWNATLYNKILPTIFNPQLQLKVRRQIIVPDSILGGFGKWRINYTYIQYPDTPSQEGTFIAGSINTERITVPQYSTPPPPPPETFTFDINQIREAFADKIYHSFFQSSEIPGDLGDIKTLQTTIRDGFITTGRQSEDEKLVLFKKDRNTPENIKDFSEGMIDTIITDISASISNDGTTGFVELATFLDDEVTILSPTVSNRFPSEETNNNGVSLYYYEITTYKLQYKNVSMVIPFAEYKTFYANDGVTGDPTISYVDPETGEPKLIEWTNILNLSQLTVPKLGTRTSKEKANEILDTTIFELLPTQRTRQNEIDEFFVDFNEMIGPAPVFDDVDNDNVGEVIQDSQENIRISTAPTNPSSYITRINEEANEVNVDKTIESMRNRLNQYLGDVDNIVEEIQDERPEYENKSEGFLKIRKPNQAIIIRDINGGELEFQKNDSFLTDGFTITQWIRFVGKTGRGTLFSFGNPYKADIESRYGFRLETITMLDNQDIHRRMVRLVVWDHIQNKLYDSNVPVGDRDRYNTVLNDEVAYRLDETDSRFWDHVIIPTDDLNEWFFICATYDPTIDEDDSFTYAEENNFLKKKQFWLGHYIVPPPGASNQGTYLGHKKIEVSAGDSDIFGNLVGANIEAISTGESSIQFSGTVTNFVNSIITFSTTFDTSVLDDNMTVTFAITYPQTHVSRSGYGARCKVEVISRSELLRARGYKVDKFDIPLE